MYDNIICVVCKLTLVCVKYKPNQYNFSDILNSPYIFPKFPPSLTGTKLLKAEDFFQILSVVQFKFSQIFIFINFFTRLCRKNIKLFTT